MEIEVKRLIPALADDFFRFFEETAFPEHPEWGCDCYCCFYHAASAREWEEQTPEQNRQLARKMILSGEMCGLLAYEGDKPVGWCHFDGRDRFPGLKVFYPQVTEKEEGIGAVVCFTVAQGYRNRGIAKKLLERACTELKSMGYQAAEVYPMRNCDSDEKNYHGPLAMYLSKGFTVHRELKDGCIMRRALD